MHNNEPNDLNFGTTSLYALIFHHPKNEPFSFNGIGVSKDFLENIFVDIISK